ncbi:TonB family protein [Psychrobacter sp. CAL346-MNA-CIBAN-0220]|uniref:energy transducer TonB n=1 Tax=Psychrobacter sp. CAL346-MNA-CIBAN-0220 TaxID=3140457 RepID=UPI0033306076
MGSTNFNAPPLKITLLASSVVIALHVLTAMALVAIKPPVPVVKQTAITSPIEIQLVTLPVEIATSEIKIEGMAPIKELKPQPESAAEPELKPQAVKKSQPEVKPNPPVIAQKKPAPEKPASKMTTPESKTQPDIPKVVNHAPFEHEVQRQASISAVQADNLAVINERKAMAAQAEKAAQEVHIKVMRDAQVAADAKAARAAQAVADTKTAQAAARTKADTDAKAAAAASNTPVNFNASNANWASTPNFSFPSRAARRANSGDTFNLVLILRVNKQGGIDSVGVAQSSGNPILDKEAQRQVRSGKFKPFMKNGVPVVGNVTLPISYAVP